MAARRRKAPRKRKLGKSRRLIAEHVLWLENGGGGTWKKDFSAAPIFLAYGWRGRGKKRPPS